MVEVIHLVKYHAKALWALFKGLEDFHSVSCRCLIWKLRMYGLDKWVVVTFENCLACSRGSNQQLISS